MSVSTAPEDQSDLNFGVVVTLFNETSNLLDSTDSNELEEGDEIEVRDQYELWTCGVCYLSFMYTRLFLML